jgi:hypothetical protein
MGHMLSLEKYLTKISKVKPLKNFTFTKLDTQCIYGTKELDYNYYTLDNTKIEFKTSVDIAVWKSYFKRPHTYPVTRVERFYDLIKQINQTMHIDTYLFPVDALHTFVNATSILTLVDSATLLEYSLSYSGWVKGSMTRTANVHKKRKVMPFNELWETINTKFKGRVRQTEETENSYSGISRPIKFELLKDGVWVKKEVTARLLLTRIRYK